MTGIFLRIQRDGRYQNLDVVEMTDEELRAHFGARDDCAKWVVGLVKWIRENVDHEERTTNDDLQAHAVERDQRGVCSECGGTGTVDEDGSGALGYVVKRACPRGCGDAKATWMTVINREGTVEALPWKDEQSARHYFDPAQMQWSESWLLRVVIGPRDVVGFTHPAPDDGRRAPAPIGPNEIRTCWCYWCLDGVSEQMILCPACGNKRCPRASDHRFACTGSNEPGQTGSIYGEPLNTARMGEVEE